MVKAVRANQYWLHEELQYAALETLLEAGRRPLGSVWTDHFSRVAAVTNQNAMING